MSDLAVIAIGVFVGILAAIPTSLLLVELLNHRQPRQLPPPRVTVYRLTDDVLDAVDVRLKELTP